LKYFAWLLKAVIFFVLFAFALNNQSAVELHFFFGNKWQAPLVLVVLVAFGSGLFAGIAVMLPIWLRGRKRLAALKASPVARPSPINETAQNGH
jgi:uncharacterized integral membrane protein